MTNTSLLERWKKAQQSRVRFHEFVLSTGLTEAAVRSKIYRERKGQTSPLPKVEGVGSVTVSENKNTMEVVSTGKRIQSLDDLLTACSVDLKTWQVERWKANKWEVGVKVGKGENARVVAEPLFQVEASLVRIALQEYLIPVTPISLSSENYKRKPAAAKTSGRAFIVPDAQIGFRRDVLSGCLEPFHDRQALDVALQIAGDGDFDEVVYLGDLLDLNEWSDKFLREPGFYFTTQPAIFEGHFWLREFVTAAPKAVHKKLEGNHEYRLAKMMITHLMAAYGLVSAEGVRFPVLSIENLLGLDKLGIEYISGYPNNSTYIGCVRAVHGDIARRGSTETVKAAVADSEETVIMGHIHKIEWASRTIKDRKGQRVVSAFSPGCLCRVDYVVPGHSRNQQWQQGCAVVEWDGDDFAITPIVIQNGRAIYKGKVYTARDMLPLLNKATKQARRGWSY
jgi:hypothetical protein